MNNELQHWNSHLAARAAATVSYHLAALGNSPPGFDGTAANTLMSSLLIASLQKKNNHHKQTQLALNHLRDLLNSKLKHQDLLSQCIIWTARLSEDPSN